MDSDSLFMAQVAHELRNPLSVLRGYAELLEEGGLSSEQHREVGGKIVAMTQRIDRILSALQLLSGGKAMSAIPLDLEALVREAVRRLREVHPEVECTFSLEKLFIQGDEELLLIALSNLLENSVRYSSVPASIALQLEQTGELICLTIEDRGIGISPEFLSQIFEPFFSIDRRRSHRAGGVGLGLSLVKTVVERHGGTIEVASIPEKGTSFAIQFPALKGASILPVF